MSASGVSLRPERYQDVARLLGDLRRFQTVFGPAQGPGIGQLPRLFTELYVYMYLCTYIYILEYT